MRRVKRRIFAGAVCEQIVYNIPDRVRCVSSYSPRPRAKEQSQKDSHKVNISRRRHALNFNANFSPTSLYSTLTFDAENELHEFKDARRIRDNFVRALRRAYPEAIIFIYMGKGKTTSRIHLHMVSDGIPEEVISSKWRYGDIKRISHLRQHNYYDGVDHGQDYSGLANYLFNHWTPDQGGHRWKQTRTARKPEMESITEIKTAYTEHHPPKPPKGYVYIGSSQTEYGYQCFRYVLDQGKKSAR